MKIKSQIIQLLSLYSFIKLSQIWTFYIVLVSTNKLKNIK